jgi:hypothetical protein
VKRDRNVALALELCARGRLEVAAVTQGTRHALITLIDGKRVLVSRGSSAGEHGMWVIKRDIGRIIHAREAAR